jgi:hypothetical protein
VSGSSCAARVPDSASSGFPRATGRVALAEPGTAAPSQAPAHASIPAQRLDHGRLADDLVDTEPSPRQVDLGAAGASGRTVQRTSSTTVPKDASQLSIAE